MLVSINLVLWALCSTAYGIAFPGPAPTAASEATLQGISPKPTGRSLSLPELFRRQETGSLCGYLEGDSRRSSTCSVGSCTYDLSLSWFGCCTGLQCIDKFTTCVDYTSISSCSSDPACASDKSAAFCADSEFGVCQTLWGYPDGEASSIVSNFQCGATSTIIRVLGATTDGADIATETAISTRGGSQTRSTSPGSDGDESSSVTRSSRASTSSSTIDDRPEVNSVVTATTRAGTTAQSTAGAAKTAQAVLGAAGGIAGVIAWFL